MPEPIGLIHVDVFDLAVAVFTDDETRVAVLISEGCPAAPWDARAIASTHIDELADGEPRFSFVIKPLADAATWAHECSHMADFICDRLGIPISIETTEVRAYLVGHFMAGLTELLIETNTTLKEY